MRIVKNNNIYDFLEPTTTRYGKCSITDRCCFCERVCLDEVYVQMISKLKLDGLISQNYKMRCCYCDYLLKHPEKIKSEFNGIVEYYENGICKMADLHPNSHIIKYIRKFLKKQP